MDGPLCGQPWNTHWSRLTATGVSNALPLSEEAVTTISRISPSKTFLQETYTLPSGPAAIAVLQQGQALSSSLIFFSNVLPPSRDRVKYADELPFFPCPCLLPAVASFSLLSSHATRSEERRVGKE